MTTRFSRGVLLPGAAVFLVLLFSGLDVIEPRALAAPKLVVQPPSLGFSGQTGIITSQQVSITEAAGGALSWSAGASTTSGGNWLTATPATGNAPSTLTVGVNTTGLAPGTYLGQVTITAAGADGSPFQLLVTLSLAAPPPTAAATTVLRTLVMHQITSLTGTITNWRRSFALSGDGSRVAFAIAPGTETATNPNRIYVINADGTGQREVDNYVTGCFCGSSVDISGDGSKIISSEGVQLRIANADGTGARALISGVEVNQFRISGDGSKVVFTIRRDSGGKERGLYIVNADGSGLRQVAGPTQVGAVAGVAASAVFPIDTNGPGLAVSSDGTKIIFATQVGTTLGDFSPQQMFGVNSDGSGLHAILGPFLYITNADISDDGRKVGYNITPPPCCSTASEAGIVNFDGTGRRALASSTTSFPFGFATSSDNFQVSGDGSKLLLGSTSVLFDTATGAAVQLGVRGAFSFSDPPPAGYDGMFRATMNSAATRFVYVSNDAGNIPQLIILDINPTALGAAPSLTSPALAPAYVLTASRSTATVSLRVSASNTLIRVAHASLLNGLTDLNVPGDILHDDGAAGDVTANDGVFTSNTIRANSVAAVGSRTVRIKTEVRAADGKRHATAVDIAPFSVLSVAATNPPKINSLIPTSGFAGSQVTISGSGFDSTAANILVSFGGRQAQVASASSTALVVTVPADLLPGAAQVNVTVQGLTSNGVVFTVLAAASLAVAPQALNISASVGASSTSHVLEITSAGASVSWSASVTLLNGAGWLSLSPASGSATSSLTARLTVTVNYSALSGAGAYQALISVIDTATRYSVAVPVSVVLSAPQGRLALSHTAFLFTAAAGGPAPPAQTLRIFNSGQGSLSWTIPANLASWLTFSSLAGTATGSTTLTANPAGLQAGVYQALAPVSASGAGNSPQLVNVTLHVLPAASQASAVLQPHGLVFVSGQGATPASQTLTISNAGAGTLSFQLARSTVTGGNWLSVTPSSGSTSGGPATVQVSASPAGLAAGVYRGKLTGTFSAGAAQEVDVVLVVSPDPVAPLGVGNAAVCASQSHDLVATTLGQGASLPVSFPRTLQALVVDNCGNAVNNATVLAAIESVSITLQPVGSGLYQGSWVPDRAAAAIVVNFSALHPTFATVRRSFTVSTITAAGGTQLPVMFADGVVEGAGFTPRRPLAPGGIISIFGARFAASEALAGAVPLSRELAGVRVRIGSLNAPLYYAGPGQVNAQVPFEVEGAESVSVAVIAGGLLTAPQVYPVAPVQPGVFRAGAGVAILDGQSRLITAENPARIGDTLQIYATGLGSVDAAVESGAALPGPSNVRAPVTVTIGGVQARVDYQGLAPGFVGLYQVNAVVPSGVAEGDAVPVVLRQNGVVNNPDQLITVPLRK